jgi:serine/threonine protein kinase/tetratricopeptide (TPR) repeat protein
MAKYCPKCKSNNPETATFCANCGTQLPSIEDIEVTETIEAPKEELTRGTTFAGRYEIIEELGKGGMGRVYRVEDKKLEQEVALKLIKPEIAKDKKTVERFRNELKLARNIRHKNVCGMFDLGEEKGTHYITMEFVPGEDLRSLIRRIGQLPIGKSLSIAKQICEGLAEAHRLSVVHRDLKSNNIMIDKEGNVRIMDFGIARSLEAKGITGSGVMIGTPEYMSPEQVEGKEVDQRSDIYSLGIIFYEMLTGRVPFEGDTPFSIGVKQKSEQPKDPKESNTQIPEDLNRLILKCLEKDKTNRYQTSGQVLSELTNIEKGIPTAERIAPRGKPLTSREITVKFTPKKLFIPVAAIVVLIAAMLFFLFWPRGPGLDPKRVVVAPFENKTGDSKLDNIGFMASDWITQGLMRADKISVSSLPMSDAITNLREEKDLIQEISKATGAGKVVTGSYYLEEEAIRFVAQVHDARQAKVLGSVDPVTGPSKEPVKAIESLRQKVMGVLALVMDAELPTSFFGHIPTYEAYQAFMEGWKVFNRFEWNKSIELYYEAMELDPDFVIPLSAIAAAYVNLGEYEKSEEVTKKLAASRDKLTPWHKMFLEQHQAILRGDRNEEYNTAKRMYEMDPEPNSYNFGWSALRINRPREAIQVLKTADPESIIMKGWIPYWNCYAYAYHMLGEHKKELKIAQQGRKYYPDRYDALWIEMRALAAMGRTEDLELRLEESRQLPPFSDWDRQWLLAYSGQELRVHGYRDESLDFLGRAIQELKNRPESETQTADYRSRMANLLYWTERWEEAKTMYEVLAEENPESLYYQSFLGLIAARMGEREEAQRISDELGKVERPYLFGQISYHQACIASLLGEKEKAVKLLQESVDQGGVFGPFSSRYHPNFSLEPLADYPPFREFIKPKG